MEDGWGAVFGGEATSAARDAVGGIGMGAGFPPPPSGVCTALSRSRRCDAPPGSASSASGGWRSLSSRALVRGEREREREREREKEKERETEKRERERERMTGRERERERVRVREGEKKGKKKRGRGRGRGSQKE